MKEDIANRLIEKMEERRTLIKDKLPEGELRERKLETIDRRIESLQNRSEQSEGAAE